MKFKMDFAEIEPISVNNMYIPTVSKPDNNGKRHGFLRSSNELMSFQDKFDEMLKHYENDLKKFVEDCNSKYEYLGFKVTILLRLPKTEFFYIRKSDDLRPNDVSNYLKGIEDRISVLIGKDDKYNVEIHASKYYSDEDYWGFSVILEPVNYMNYNDQLYKEVFNEN